MIEIGKKAPEFCLPDQTKEMLKIYGAWGKKRLYGKEYEGMVRSTFIYTAPKA